MSKEINTALRNLVNKFHKLTQPNPANGQYNFYVEHFMRDGKAIDNAVDDLTHDKTGFFSEFAMCEMADEVEELIRAICQAEVYTTYWAYYNPQATFITREQYIADERERALKAREKQNEYYAKLAEYYNNKTATLPA